jgi:asparagine synthetase B (glutamine-hydrolysing)
MNLYKNILVPAIGGTISSKKIDIDYNKYKIVRFNNNVNFYLNKISEDIEAKYYHYDESYMLWTGGFGKNFDLKSFDVNNYEDKFIFFSLKNKELKIFSDHYSRIPLYFYHNECGFYFSTSMKMLLTMIPDNQTIIDFESVLFYYNYGFPRFNNLLVKHIKSLPPSQNITINVDQNTYKSAVYRNYYNPNPIIQSNSLKQNSVFFNDSLFKSTKIILDDFNKIGISISGGVDSGYIAQKIKQCGKKFYSYTVGYKNAYNEFDRVDLLSSKLNFKVKKIIVDEKDIIDNFIECSEISSTPVYFNNSILNFVYEAASNDSIDVMFDGDGVDRVFLGSNGHVRLNFILKLYLVLKRLNLNYLFPKFLTIINVNKLNPLKYYFNSMSQGYPFHGERQLSKFKNYSYEFEKHLNSISLPEELKSYMGNNHWLYYTLFGLYYFSNCFLHNQYELQLSKGIIANPHYWKDSLLDIALNTPTNQKLFFMNTKRVVREAASINLNSKYWNLKKRGLDNAFQYIKNTSYGNDFINSIESEIKKSEEFLYLSETMPHEEIDPSRLISYYFWKKNLI